MIVQPTIDEFLDRNVEGYLLGDIATLKTARPPEGKDDGACGYPLVMTVFSGIELLGALSSQSKFNMDGGRLYFASYWQQYLYPEASDPARAKAGPGLYALARHGLAHAFVTKGPLVVSKGFPARHLTNADHDQVIIDAGQLAEDFERSYRDRFKSYTVTDRPKVVQRLSEMWNAYRDQAHGVAGKPGKIAAFTDLPNQGPLPVTTGQGAGFSGAGAPITSSWKSS